MSGNDASPTVTDVDRPLAVTTEAKIAPLVRRRRVLEALESLSGRATVDELVATLLAADHEAVDGGPERIRIRLRLRHVDLPLLADLGRIAYDPDRGRARLLD